MKTFPDLPGLRNGTSSFTARNSARKKKKKKKKEKEEEEEEEEEEQEEEKEINLVVVEKKGVLFGLVSPLSTEYPETFGAANKDQLRVQQRKSKCLL